MSDPTVIPAAVRRNHWMNQVATHAEMKPDAPAFRFLGETCSASTGSVRSRCPSTSV